MSWTGWVALAATLVALSGCVYGYHSVRLSARHGPAGRPHASYYCYDCHGNRYFDPYYDWCVGYGYRYSWRRHPQAIDAYRQRYVRIREQNPDYGRYRYTKDYRRDPRYRRPPVYEGAPPAKETEKVRPGEPRPRDRGREEPERPRKKDDGRDRGAPGDRPSRDAPRGGGRP